ncbi:DNA cytosine methyltransferase [Rhizobium sp. ZK1]|uniref:DNA cytosine methyltransferase n=1 Tax=Rhizobium sp. ZK1 TaxID=3389872 RepID=UPI0039F66DCF
MRAVELFCGAGGMSRGLLDAGFNIAMAFDAWPVAVEAYRRNVGSHVEEANLGDLLTVIPKITRLAPDMICGGPPCQDYSLAGRRIEGENASMTLAFAMVVVTVRPEWFLMENVTQAASSSAWAEAKAMLKRAGYGLSESKINCALYGVPQKRRRLFVVGRLGEKDGFLQSSIAAAASARERTVRDSLLPNYFKMMPDDDDCFRISDLKVVAGGHLYSRPLQKGRAVRTVDEAFATITRTSGEAPTPRYRDHFHLADSASIAKAATLDLRQISRIQGFPPAWNWTPASKRNTMQMIANAVPPPVARAIGRVILERHRGRSFPQVPGGFLTWLIRHGGKSRPAAYNYKSYLRRVRRILRGRTYADLALELAALEASPEFVALPKQQKSDLRQAVRLFAQYGERPRQPVAEPGDQARVDTAALMARWATLRAHDRHDAFYEDDGGTMETVT